jgi:hypothetical protein
MQKVRQREHNQEGTHIIGGLGRLIQCDHGRHIKQIGLETQIVAEVNGICAIEPARGVVPALQLGAGEGCLGDADSFALSTADPSHKFVSNTRAARMVQAKDGHHDIATYRVELVAAETPWDVPDRASTRGKRQGLANGEVRQVCVELCVVQNVTAERRTNMVQIKP